MNVASLDLSGSELLNFLEDLTALIIVSMNDNTRDEFASNSTRRAEISDGFREFFEFNCLLETDLLLDSRFNLFEGLFVKIGMGCMLLNLSGG